MCDEKKEQAPLKLLAAAPCQEYSRLIVRYPYQTDGHYAHAYHFSAQRLASTFKGRPVDDLMLIPFLALYRQAIELQLKDSIRCLVELRMQYVDGRTQELESAVSLEKFKKGFSHNLHKLLNETKKHYSVFGFPEEFPKSVEMLVLNFHDADERGTAFRYAGNLPNTQEHVDFPELAGVLDQGFKKLCCILDEATYLCECTPTLAEQEAEASY